MVLIKANFYNTEFRVRNYSAQKTNPIRLQAERQQKRKSNEKIKNEMKKWNDLHRNELKLLKCKQTEFTERRMLILVHIWNGITNRWRMRKSTMFDNRMLIYANCLMKIGILPIQPPPH